MATVKVIHNVWGNYCFMVGAAKVRDSGEKWVATEWLAEQLAAGHTLSAKSHITMAEVDAHRARLAPQSALESCAADVAVLFKTHDTVGWAIERLFTMEFISDQQLDTLHESFARSGDRDLFRYGLMPVY